MDVVVEELVVGEVALFVVLDMVLAEELSIEGVVLLVLGKLVVEIVVLVVPEPLV